MVRILSTSTANSGATGFVNDLTTALLKTNNLSDLSNLAAARNNLSVYSEAELAASGSASVHWDNVNAGDVPTFTNQADNRILYCTPTTNDFEASETLKFNGTTLSMLAGAGTQITSIMAGSINLVNATGTGFLLINDNDNVDDVSYPVILTHQAPSVNATDAFRIGMKFVIDDTGMASPTMAEIRAMRNGADTTGILHLQAYSTGAAAGGLDIAGALITANSNFDFDSNAILNPGLYTGDLTFDDTNRAIYPAATTTNSLTVRGSDPAGSTGGVLALRGGNSNTGGFVTLIGGAGAAGVGGGISIIGGASATTTGGNVIMLAGAGNITANTGNVFIGDVGNGDFVQIGDSLVAGAPKGVLDVYGDLNSNTIPQIWIENKDITNDTSVIMKRNADYYTYGIDATDGFFKIVGDVAANGLVQTDANIGFSYDYNAGVPQVGIGENSPAYLLHLTTNNVAGDAMLYINQEHAAGDCAVAFKIPALVYSMGIDNSDDVFRIYGASTIGGTDALTGFAYDYNGGTALVGIAENSPASTLHVGGNVRSDGEFILDGTDSLTVVSRKYTISFPHEAGGTGDFDAESVHNKNPQPFNLGLNMVGLSRVVDVIIYCNDNWSGTVSGNETGMNATVGNVSGGAQYTMSATSVSNVGDIINTTVNGTFEIGVVLTTSQVWIGLTPTDNFWDEFDSGEITVYVTYNEIARAI